MKKYIFLFLMVFATLAAKAEFRWGPTVGLNVSTLSWKQDLVGTSYTPGVNAGVMGELMIPGIGFGIDMALKYSGHGADINFGDQFVWSSEGYGKERYTLHSLQIPVNLRFKWTRMNGAERIAAPFVYGGPLLSFNLAATKLPVMENPLGSFGVQAGIGGEFFERYQLSAGYLWGMSYDCRTVKLDNFSAQNRGWQVNLAVLF